MGRRRCLPHRMSVRNLPIPEHRAATDTDFPARGNQLLAGLPLLTRPDDSHSVVYASPHYRLQKLASTIHSHSLQKIPPFLFSYGGIVLDGVAPWEDEGSEWELESEPDDDVTHVSPSSLPLPEANPILAEEWRNASHVSIGGEPVVLDSDALTFEIDTQASQAPHDPFGPMVPDAHSVRFSAL